MNTIKLSVKRVLILAGLIAMGGKAIAQDAITLHIGDPAPEIKYSKWLKGTPVNSYEDDRLYVLEFWATWCGPCIAAIPHLSELAEKYEDNATFIGVNIWEGHADTSKPYKSYLPKVSRFVNAMGDKMAYNVIMDTNNRFMASNWMNAAGIRGIPSTFVIKEGKIAWIGHPMKLDEILSSIIADTFDVAAFKKERKKGLAASVKRSNKVEAAINAVEDAVAADNFEKAFQLVDEGIEKMPFLGYVLRMKKFNILLKHFDEEKALNYAEEIIKQNDSFLIGTAIQICKKDGLSKEAYLFAANNLKKALEERSFSALYDKLAVAYSKAGNLEAAVEAQQKAVDAAKEEVNDPDFAGRVFDYTITSYEATLDSLRQVLKEK